MNSSQPRAAWDSISRISRSCLKSSLEWPGYPSNVLRKLFGPSKKEIWRKLSEEMNGRFIEGGFLKQDKVEVSHGEWVLTLDTYVQSAGKTVIVFTRMRAPYVNPDGFRFTIYRRGFFSGIA